MSYRNSRKSEKVSISKGKLIVPFVFLFLVVLFRFAYLYLNQFIESSLVSSQQSQELNISVQELETFFPLKFKASLVSAHLQSANIPLSALCTSLEGSVSIPSLALFKKSLLANALCYKGRLELLFSGSLFSEQSKINLKADDLGLKEHPLSQFLGISGNLSFEGHGQVKGELLESAEGSVEIKQGEYSGGHKVGGLVAIPAVSQVELKCQADYSQNKQILNLESCSGDSTLGSVEARGEAKILESGKLIYGTAEIELDLSELGKKELAPYLSLASGRFSENPGGRWKVSLKRAADGRETSHIREF